MNKHSAHIVNKHRQIVIVIVIVVLLDKLHSYIFKQTNQFINAEIKLQTHVSAPFKFIIYLLKAMRVGHFTNTRFLSKNNLL